MVELRTVYRNSDGVRRTMITDSDRPDEVIVKTEVDVTGVFDNNKIMRELHPTNSVNKLLARGIPMTVYEKSVLEQWDDGDWKRWLNDPDNKMFRI